MSVPKGTVLVVTAGVALLDLIGGEEQRSRTKLQPDATPSMSLLGEPPKDLVVMMIYPMYKSNRYNNALMAGETG